MSELHQALLRAKRNITPPQKNSKAMYGRYADLEAVLGAVEPALAGEGLLLSHSGRIVDGQPTLVTSLIHAESGDTLESVIPLVSKNSNDPQQLGGSITYARRYGISALLSIVADDDDDGNTSSGKERDGSKKKGVSEEEVKEAFTTEQNISKKKVEGVFKEFERAGFDDGEVVPEIRKLLGRRFGQLAEITEAEATTAVGHARKVKRGDVQRLTE